MPSGKSVPYNFIKNIKCISYPNKALHYYQYKIPLETISSSFKIIKFYNFIIDTKALVYEKSEFSPRS